MRISDLKKNASRRFWKQDQTAERTGLICDRKASSPALSLLVINEGRIEDASSNLQNATEGENAARQSFLYSALVQLIQR